MKINKKIFIILVFLVSLIIIFPKLKTRAELYFLEKEQQKTQSLISNFKKEQSDKTKNSIEIAEQELKEFVHLEVPFVTQAPLENEANWEIHEESCEEAAVYQVIAFLKGIKEIDRTQADLDLKKMIAWQELNLGSHHDLYAQELKKFILGYYPEIKSENILIIENSNLTQIKKLLSQGYPIIAPITGELLKNPYYPYPGYHMLTIIGYTEDKVITNDVGTKRGKNFSYDWDIFLKALSDSGGDILIIKSI